MSNVPWPAEAATRPDVEPIPSRTLVFAARITRLAELAAERLMCAPSDDDLEAAVGALNQIRNLAGEVLR
jgi:hypothetical protein